MSSKNASTPPNEPMDIETLRAILHKYEADNTTAPDEESMSELEAALHHWHNQQAYKEVLELVETLPTLSLVGSSERVSKNQLRQAAKEYFKQ